MKEDFSELVEYLDKKFNKIDEKFGNLPDVFATREEIVKMVDTLVTKESFNELQTAVDTYAKKADTYFQEMLMLAQKVDRHEKWLHQLAEKFGVKLEY